MRNISKSVKRFCSRLGLSVYASKTGYICEVIPDYHGKSAHKQIDIRTIEPFATIADKILSEKRSCLYYDRLYTLYQGVRNLEPMASGARNIAEIGVYRGGGLAFMAKCVQDLLGGTVGLHGFDTFSGHDPSDIDAESDNTSSHCPGKFSATSYESVKAYLEPFPNVVLHQGRIQDTASVAAPIQFGLVHLDVDLYEPTLFGLEFFVPRLIEGGMLILDDYDRKTCPGVRAAVEKFNPMAHSCTQLAMLSAQCVLMKY